MISATADASASSSRQLERLMVKVPSVGQVSARTALQSARHFRQRLA